MVIRRYLEQGLWRIKASVCHGYRALRRLPAKRVLLYADSRGDNIPNHQDYAHFGARLAQQYRVDSYLCPETWTTTLDFLALAERLPLDDYDAIVLHTGVVDASPRHREIARNIIYPSKKRIFDSVFGEQAIATHLNHDFRCDYEGDSTINLYSLDMARTCLLPRLRGFPRLVWISGNRIVPGWRGNYWKDRPSNIALIEDYFRLFLTELPRSVNLMSWTEAEVVRRTFDNIHPNREGSDWIYARLTEWLRQL